MPLLKRIVYDATVYQQAYYELCDDAPTSNLIADRNMSTFLGVLLQISYLSAYSIEVSLRIY